MAYKAEDFINAIPGTGGVISAIADKVGCSWQVAKKYCTEYATVKAVYDAERSRVTDKAQSNIITAIVKKSDLAMSKWWLQVKDPDFKPKQEIDINEVKILVSIDDN